MMNKTVMKVGAIVLCLGLASGCASTAAIEKAQATADRAASDAAAAMAAAEGARATADRAAQAAAGAQSTADQAMSAASAAQACCDANRDRLERMFQKSMSK